MCLVYSLNRRLKKIVLFFQEEEDEEDEPKAKKAKTANNTKGKTPVKNNLKASKK